MAVTITQRIQRIPLFLALLLLPVMGMAQPDDTLSVLFVGNSFTFFWNLPQVVSAMGESQGVPIRTSRSTVGGASLEQHWKGEKGTNTRPAIEAGGWDYVVLQNHSTSAMETPESFMEYGRKFAGLARSAGAEPLYFTTWAYKSNPLMQPAITAAYAQLAKEVDAGLTPVGPLWESVRRSRPDLELFFDDKHPTPVGTYLIGLAFYKQLTGQPVKEIPNRLATTDRYGEPLNLLFVLPEDGAFLRQAVDEFDFKEYTDKD
ncbi:MAG: hypothetical protein H6573_35610 [Lewinellaceae bacterium]|nr:hypothetical protein [Phaeodactylibacter sp.]MCB9351671.1 hypothetical protein [Lewinellaceae bacterium]MCB9352773.1 hypothetical protein [Lewinellaceae bacterium]